MNPDSTNHHKLAQTYVVAIWLEQQKIVVQFPHPPQRRGLPVPGVAGGARGAAAPRRNKKYVKEPKDNYTKEAEDRLRVDETSSF